MSYTTEYDSEGNVIKDYSTDEYGNVDIYYISEELENDKSLNIGKMFRQIVAGHKLQLSINKQLYESGNISKELYEIVEVKILERMSPFKKYIEA